MLYFPLSIRTVLLCIIVQLFEPYDDDTHCMSPMRGSTDPSTHVVRIRLLFGNQV